LQLYFVISHSYWFLYAVFLVNLNSACDKSLGFLVIINGSLFSAVRKCCRMHRRQGRWLWSDGKVESGGQGENSQCFFLALFLTLQLEARESPVHFYSYPSSPLTCGMCQHEKAITVVICQCSRANRTECHCYSA